LVVGLVIGSVLLLVFWLDTEINPVEALRWSWKEARSKVIVWSIIGGLSLGVASGLGGDLIAGVVFGLLGGLLVGVIVGLLGGLTESQIPGHLSYSPNEGIWRSGKNGLLGGVVGGTVGGLLGGLVVGFVTGLLGWLLFSSAFGLVDGLGAFAKHFILRFFLSRRGDLPWALVPFLDEAAQRLLLRKVGGTYVFAHRLLRDYFADLAGEE
jgi:MFS family permease